MSTTVAEADQEFSVLEMTDRCDACGSQAYVLVLLEDEKTLFFCGHHWHRYSKKLIELAVDIVDETAKIS
jgi:hypothetical protein